MSSLLEYARENGQQEYPKDILNKVAAMLERSGISPDDVHGSLEKVRINEWQSFYKDADGVGHVVDLEGGAIVLSPQWETGPEWPVVQPCKPHTVSFRGKFPQTRNTSKLETAVIWPDIQIGFFRDNYDNLIPTHDEAALSVALQITRAAKPDRVVLVGDNLDLPELSKYRKTPAFARTTQATVDRGGELVAELRSAVGPDCLIDWIEGNHEKRIASHIIDNALAAFGLRTANAPESWPVLSVPHLCRLDEHGVTYHAGYPASRVWLNERLQVVHGDVVSSNNSTAHKYLARERVSTIFGHIHRRERAERTRHTEQGPRTVLAASPGCLCRIDGTVPSTKCGTDLDGLPVEHYEDWQQGIAVVKYEPGDGRFVYDEIEIWDGWAMYKDREYVAT